MAAALGNIGTIHIEMAQEKSKLEALRRDLDLDFISSLVLSLPLLGDTGRIKKEKESIELSFYVPCSAKSTVSIDKKILIPGYRF